MNFVNNGRRTKIAAIFGTRPETIKMAPVLREFANQPWRYDLHSIMTLQHSDLLFPLLELFDVPVHQWLSVPRERYTLDELVARLLEELTTVLEEISPDFVLVQGDTATAFAGALSAHHHRIPVIHIEAGLRSGNRYSPYPEEMYRRMITKLASYHMAATPANVETLLAESVPEDSVYLTGNPVVDAVQAMLVKTVPSNQMQDLIDRTRGMRTIVVTTHRRESFGSVMRTHLSILRDFVERHDDVCLIFPVHPNPAVREECDKLGMSGPRMQLISPLVYSDFIHLLNSAWLVASDSGGVQEEVPTLRKPLLVLRENTERPEVLTSGFGRLVGPQPHHLAEMLNEIYECGSWLRTAETAENPFGDGKSGARIVNAISNLFWKPSDQKLLA